MANTAPVARLTANKTEITLPDNEVILDASGSTDANANAVLSYRYYQTGGPGGITITNPNFALAKVNFTQAGDYDMSVDVTDRGGLVSTATISFKVNPMGMHNTRFGAKITSIPINDQITVLKKLGCSYIRLAEVLKNFSGYSKNVDACFAAGIKVLLNISYDLPGSVHGFCKDLKSYRTLIDKLLSAIGSKIEVAVIENEPTVDVFWGKAPVSDYIAMLKVAVESCHAHGVKVTDGALHPVGLTSGDSGTLLNAYKDIDLDYVNMHNKITKSYKKGTMVDAGNKVKQVTGKPIMSNEFHLESGVGDQNIKDFVQDIKDGGYIYGLIWGGNLGGGAPINNGTNLTHLGEVYRDSI